MIVYDEFPQELFATVPCVSDWYVYQMHVGNSGSSGMHAGELELVCYYYKPNQYINAQQYFIPADTRELRIVYRGQYPVGEPGESIHLVASLRSN